MSNANNILEVDMNIHFPQVERKSQVSSYMLAVFALSTMLLLALSFIRMFELRLSVPSISVHTSQAENTNIPVAIPVPVPPVEQAQSIVTPEPAGNTPTILVPQIVPAPAPSVQ
jgi:hypothetical protein